jgi:hypothetical protein
MERFTREAQVLASLNHPNIAAIYGIEDRAIVLELVEGQWLSERIAQGPLSLDDALAIARQIGALRDVDRNAALSGRDGHRCDGGGRPRGAGSESGAGPGPPAVAAMPRDGSEAALLGHWLAARALPATRSIATARRRSGRPTADLLPTGWLVRSVFKASAPERLLQLPPAILTGSATRGSIVDVTRNHELPAVDARRGGWFRAEVMLNRQVAPPVGDCVRRCFN